MASRPTKPGIHERARDHVCPECGGEVARKSVRGPFPTFCSPTCKRAFGNRQLVEGRAIIAYAKAWRIDRGSGEIAQGALAELCRVLDQFNAEDLTAGRPRADLYAAKLLRDGTQYRDRQHVRNLRESQRRAEIAAERE